MMKTCMKVKNNYVSINAIFKELGYIVFYNEQKKMIISISKEGNYISHQIGTNVMNINKKNYEFNKSSIFEKGTIMIPTNYIDKVLNLRFKLNESGKDLKTEKNNKSYIFQFIAEPYFNPEKFYQYIKYNKDNELPINEIVIHVNIGLDQPFYTNIKTINDPHNFLVLCNKYRQLPKSFRPLNLVKIPSTYFLGDRDAKIDATALEHLILMRNDAQKKGLELIIVSGYRTNSYQRMLYNNSKETKGIEHADTYSARPGHSEHETGFAIDINSVETTFENTKEFEWLVKNSYKYGYILRYPKGKEHITGYGYEPWHYRFLGILTATAVYKSGLTYDEYYVQNIYKNNYTTNF